MSSPSLIKIAEIREALLVDSFQNNGNTNLGVLAGYPGTSMFFFANYILTGQADDLDRIGELISSGFNDLNSGTWNPYFCNGVAGFAFMINFYNRKGIFDIDDELQEDLDRIDNYIFQRYKHSLNVKNFDFLHGSEGLLFYLIGTKRKEESISLFLECLELNMISFDKKGLAWKSNVSAAEGNRLVYNLGLAHGMASTLIILAKIINCGNRQHAHGSKELLKQLVEFYMSERMAPQFGSVFPNYSSLDDLPSASRLGWCYGDLGISLALWQAGNALGDTKIKTDAVDICIQTTRRRSPSETSVVDAGICHGTAGISSIYHQMYRFTGEERFKEANIFWTRETLNFARFENGRAGFKVWTKDGYINEDSLLEGIAGIGVALIAPLVKEEIGWEDTLLLGTN